MPPRPPNPAIPPDALDLMRHWLLDPRLAMRQAGSRQWGLVMPPREVSLYPLFVAEHQVKKMMGYGTWEGYVRAILKDEQLLDVTFDALSRAQQQHLLSSLIKPAQNIQLVLTQEDVYLKTQPTRRFDPSLSAYWEIFHPLLMRYPEDLSFGNTMLTDTPFFPQMVSDAIDALRDFKEATREPDYKRKLKTARHLLSQNMRSYDHYLDSLVSRHPQLHVFYLGFAYRPQIGSAVDSNACTFETAVDHFNQLMRSKQYFAVFQGLKGFVWKRDGYSTFPHLYHFFFFFDPEALQKRPDLKEQLAELWMEQVTQGQGVCLDLLNVPRSHNPIPVAWCCTLPMEENRTTVLLDRQHASFEPRFQELKRMVHALLQVDRLTYLEFPAGYPRLGRGQLPVSS